MLWAPERFQREFELWCWVNFNLTLPKILDTIKQMNTTTLNIPISKQEKERLSRLALSYGFSLPEFSQRILKEISSEIGKESFGNYKNPKSLKISFARALNDYRAGRTRAKL